MRPVMAGVGPRPGSQTRRERPDTRRRGVDCRGPALLAGERRRGRGVQPISGAGGAAGRAKLSHVLQTGMPAYDSDFLRIGRRTVMLDKRRFRPEPKEEAVPLHPDGRVAIGTEQRGTDASADRSYQSSKMLTPFRRFTPHERRRAFALASGQNFRPLV